jgi:hypothetical protein
MDIKTLKEIIIRSLDDLDESDRLLLGQILTLIKVHVDRKQGGCRK